MDATALEPWLALYLILQADTHRFLFLLKALGSPEACLQSDRQTLFDLGLDRDIIQKIIAYRSGSETSPVCQAVNESLAWQAREGHYILSLEDAAYPALLKEIADPPPLLFIRGKLEILALPQVALVGSRKPSTAGRRHARGFAGELAALGCSVCSGMARGIDYESHRGALQAGGPTVAVLGTGLNRIYPPQHESLALEIAEQGLLLSEFPLHAPPLAWHFPRRNRVISGLSLGVVVVEAALRSGSLISARCAMEQGREVFAVPGPINSVSSKGCHQLIKSGAKLTENVEDIVEELLPAYGPRPMSGSKQDMAEEQALSAQERRVLAAVSWQRTSMDELIGQIGGDVSEISALLIRLEMKALIETVPGGYIRTG